MIAKVMQFSMFIAMCIRLLVVFYRYVSDRWSSKMCRYATQHSDGYAIVDVHRYVSLGSDWGVFKRFENL